ncbi:hypothetical protein IWW37_004416 [Coemansia sp. RSA 2050]|nr:hypothetical protein IWW37_004416 [Coemansia sp. RSA 2050]
MLGYSGADVIELLSDDSLSDAAADNSVLEVIAAPGRNAWPGSTPSVSQTSRVLNLLTPNTPGTPDLPSPSAILGLPRRRELSSDSGGSRQAVTPTRTHTRVALVASGDSVSSRLSSNDNSDVLLSRQAALDLPSSPLAIYDDNESFDIFGSARSFSHSPRVLPPPVAATVDDDSLDSGRFLDDIIDHQLDFIGSSLGAGDRVYAGAESELELGIGPSSLSCRPYATINNADWRRETANVDYSDAVATEIIDSSSSDEELALGPKLAARAIHSSPKLSDKSRFRLFSSRSASAEMGRRHYDDVHTISTDPFVAVATSERADFPVVREISSSSSSSSNKVSRKESSAEQRRIEAERKRAERAAEKERRERERQYQRGISSVNKKQVDQRVLARDMTVVIDPGLLSLLSEPKRTAAAPSQPAPGEETQPLESSSSEDHPMFERLREEEIKYRLGQTNATCGIAWEMLVRRKWDSRTNLYVPVACAKTCKVKSVAMVVLLSDRFVELLANNRVETLLEIWRGSLATKRLFVVVVGLQKYLRRAAAVETREFARQLRTHIKDGVATALATSSKGKTRKKPLQQPEPQKQLSEEAVEEAVLRLQMTRPWATWFTQCSDTRELGRLLWQTTMDLALAEYNGDRDAVTDDGETVELAASQPDGTEFITKDVASALNVAVIRTGTDLADSWIHALTQIPKVTLPVAQSIAAQYPTPKRLFEAWQRMASEAECEQLLAQLSVASATAAGRRLGSAMSTRVYRVFNEPDPGRPFAEL